MNAARTRLTLLSAVCLVTWAGYAAADFPFNGSFEQVTRGQPIGWQMRGVWSSLTMMPTQVRRCVGIFGTVSEAGDRLVSSGYRLIGAGDETYQLTDQNRSQPPEFAIYKDDKKIASGKFEFG